MKTADFNYILPKELIATHPLKNRDASKLMLVDRKDHCFKDNEFKNISSYFEVSFNLSLH